MPRTSDPRHPDPSRTNDDAMAEATALTRSGRLAEATRTIQAALGAGRADGGGRGPDMRGDVIEGEVVARPREKARETSGAKLSGTTRAKPTGASRTKPTGTTRLVTPSVTDGFTATLARMRSATSATPAPASRSRARAKLRPVADPAMPDGARWEWRTAADGRRYRLYTPASLTHGAPLVVMLHGCTQSPDDFAVGTGMNAAAERAGAVIAYPEQTRGANPMACWNWFEPAHQRGGEAASIAAIARAVRDELGPGRTVAAGLSAGGAMAAILGHAHPDLFEAVGIHSGLPAGAARDLGSAQRAMSGGPSGPVPATAVRTIVVHGEADRTVHPANGTAAFEAALGDLPRTQRREGRATVSVATAPDGRTMAEHWRIDALAHAWAGGNAGGSYTAPDAPDATTAMLSFMLS